MQSPLLLGIDTALGGLSLSLCRGDEEIAGIRHPTLNDQAAQLVPSIEAILREAGRSYADLDGIAVTVGPGGFTGVRIGLATARAVGFAAGKPVHGVTTLALMAPSAPAGLTHFLCALPAGREQVYVQGFGGAPYAEPVMVPIEEIVATGLPCVVTEQPWTDALPKDRIAAMHDPARHAYLACCAVSRHEGLAAPLPLYIRPPDAKPQAPLV
jgi:tRNA threonylcarbamoyladenosine biosynthesis protein TsaB